MIDYLRLFRVKHYIKNLFIFTTLIFGAELLTTNTIRVSIGFIAFCLISSTIYIINDIVDYEIDKKTESKMNEPIPAGKIKKKNALILAFILLILSLVVNYFTYSVSSYVYIIVYLLLNIFYSFIGKKIPYVELLIMSCFYLIRVYYGASILNVSVSLVLTLTVVFGSLYIVIMKRITEVKIKKPRHVFTFYNENILKILSKISLVGMFISYVWWLIIEKIVLLIPTLLILLFIFIRYDKLASNSNDCNPVNILLKDKVLVLLSVFYVLFVTIVIEIFL